MTLRFLIASTLLLFPCRPALADTPPPSGAALDHIAIQVRDLDASTAFYRSVFGFADIPAPFPIARWMVAGNGLTLHIVSGRTAPKADTKWDHFAVSCADMAAMTARLDALKIEWSDIQGRKAV